MIPVVAFSSAPCKILPPLFCHEGDQAVSCAFLGHPVFVFTVNPWVANVPSIFLGLLIDILDQM